jgi:uncharacterized protein YbjQ (UPF0145 family)
VVTTESVPGRRVLGTLGVVRGNTVRARDVASDFIAFLKNLVGGEVTEYTEVIAQARELALDRMLANAEALGANAVVGLRFSTSYVTRGTAEIMAYGTAVILE